MKDSRIEVYVLGRWSAKWIEASLAVAKVRENKISLNISQGSRSIAERPAERECECDDIFSLRDMIVIVSKNRGRES